jgi:superfamily II DNA or RNA helicase
MKVDYSYQKQTAKSVLENALNSRYLASVLAACPSSGKTTISHIIINEYIKKFPNSNIVVLTEGQNNLKDQYLSELESPNVPINFSFGVFGSDKDVQIGIPQSIQSLKINQIDLLIVDECHHFYLENTDQTIIEKYKVKHQVIMTGSPTKFNKHNQTTTGKKYGIVYLAADFLQNKGVFNGVDLNVLKGRHLSDMVGFWTEAIAKGANLSKVMIACHTVLQANTVMRVMRQIGRNAIVSTSKNDINSQNIKDFKDNKYDTLIIVCRGILGFNDKMVTTLFDLRVSNSVDTSYQLFARLLRNHPDNIRKFYFRIGDNRTYNKQVMMLHKIKALMNSQIFKGFTGDNLKLELY